MNSFNDVYNDRREEQAKAKQIKIAKDHALLVEAIQTNFMIRSFSDLNEQGRIYCKSLVESMWDKTSGLNEKGLAFINEGKAPITPETSIEQIKKFFQKEIFKSIDKVVACAARGMDNCQAVKSLKESIEKDYKKKIAASDIKAWTCEIVCAYMQRKVRAFKF